MYEMFIIVASIICYLSVYVATKNDYTATITLLVTMFLLLTLQFMLQEPYEQRLKIATDRAYFDYFKQQCFETEGVKFECFNNKCFCYDNNYMIISIIGKDW